jgi:hypothetical protein
MSTAVSQRLRREVSDRAYHVCEYCLIHEQDTFWGCETDRIISRKHGGETNSENLAWACAVCNGHKGSDLGTLVGQPAQLTQLFNPRVNRWSECFQLNSLRIEPLNVIGEATVKLLQLNHDNRLREREILALVGRYPTIEAVARMKE